MELISLIKSRRSIRKYRPDRIPRETLQTIAEAGLYAPTPGGRQSVKILLLDDPKLIERIGIVNADCENRNWGRGVSADQPSIIDDPSIRSGFYGCPALAVVCVPKARRAAVNGIGSAFVCAENMVLAALDLGVSSCIVGRAEATFAGEDMQRLLREWGLSEDDTPMVFVCLGFIDGAYPPPKMREEGRVLFPTRG